MTDSTPHARRGCSPLALFGCGCGSVAMLGILIVFALLTLQMQKERVDPHWSRRDFALCQQRLSYLQRALASYRKDHHRLPATLAELSPRYVDSSDRLHCPLEARGVPFRYTPDGATIITCENHGQGPLELLRNGQLRLPTLSGWSRPSSMTRKGHRNE